MRGERDALDCSLALASEGIPHAIRKDEDYALVIGANDARQAREIVERYRLENRPPVRRLSFRHPEFDWRCSAIWCLVLAVFGYLHLRHPGMVEGGILQSRRALQGEWWLLLTATMLHVDVAHLASNLTLGFVLFGLVTGRFGIGPGLLCILLCGMGGNLLGLLLRDAPYSGLGASGCVMGALGMLGPQALGWIRRDPRAVRVLGAGLAGSLMLFVLFGFSPDSDVLAHLGGFLCGLVLGGLLVLVPESRLAQLRWNLSGSLLSLLLLLACWRRALDVPP